MPPSHTANDDEKKNAAANSVDADSFHPGSSTTTANNNEPILPLPAPDEAAEALKLDLGGDGVRLDALGPMVVNADGSLSRIANWDRMAEVERRNTLRVLGRRNRERLARLRGEGEGEK
ncbi:putative fungal specific transcription protein [Neofusicoccum parvum UCRNP2]|uniref:Putative fungal specific transcription protein n=1 Tax=Botryosphaeria parva (strain UCR-NP2) TaxID=1287680 RepID=R1ESR4_BOTPV|nr:putative fungal specific transcription protein [Neofusicoccum parvum UCRNP2]